MNGDGRPDLYVANDEDPNRLYLDEPAKNSLGFRFVERGQSDGVADANAGMGVAAGPLVLLKNTNPSGHWLEVSLAGFHPGALVTAVLPDGRRLVRELHAGSSYESSEDPRAVFGLGAATTVKTLIIRLPNGSEKRLADVAADRIVTVEP